MLGLAPVEQVGAFRVGDAPDLAGVDGRPAVVHDDPAFGVVGQVVGSVALAAEDGVLLLVGPVDAVVAEGDPEFLAAGDQFRMGVAPGGSQVVDHQVPALVPPLGRSPDHADAVETDLVAPFEDVVGLGAVDLHQSQLGGGPAEAVFGLVVAGAAQPVEAGWSGDLDQNAAGIPQSVETAVRVSENAHVGDRRVRVEVRGSSGEEGIGGMLFRLVDLAANGPHVLDHVVVHQELAFMADFQRLGGENGVGALNRPLVFVLRRGQAQDAGQKNHGGRCRPVAVTTIHSH